METYWLIAYFKSVIGWRKSVGDKTMRMVHWAKNTCSIGTELVTGSKQRTEYNLCSLIGLKGRIYYEKLQ